MKAIVPLTLLSLGVLCLALPARAQLFKAKHHLELKADGPDQGLDAYALIKKAFGNKSIESPDLYPSNHVGERHIFEDVDDVVGPHFVFLSHRDDDKDRGTSATDRQRNEIKLYAGSHPDSLAYRGDVMQFRWKFKIDEGYEFSKSFTHLFQIKAKNSSRKRLKNGGDQYPVITISGVDKGAKGNEFQLRYSYGLEADGSKASYQKLVREDMSHFVGRWIDVAMQIDFRENGKLHFLAKDLETGKRLAAYKSDDIDMWRGERKGDFSRPKWGIYRSLKDKDSLRSGEEKVRFADITVTKGKVKK